MRIRYAAKTDVGMKRTHNEDYFSLLEDDQLFLVADGMGGHASGEVASKMAAESIQEFFSRSKDAEATWPYKMDRHLSYVENRLVVGVKLANQRIFEAALKGSWATSCTSPTSEIRAVTAFVEVRSNRLPGTIPCSRTTRTRNQG